jgi:hypothetical protein
MPPAAPLRVALVGGGIGALTAARAVAAAAADGRDAAAALLRVTVYERDTASAGRHQGYAIGLEAATVDAVAGRLPGDARLAALLRAPANGIAGFALRDAAGAPLVDLPAGGAFVDRGLLRAALLRGLPAAGGGGDAAAAAVTVAFGKQLVGYTSSGSAGGAAALQLAFADGTTAQCDVLVGADGANSAVRTLRCRSSGSGSGSNTAPPPEYADRGFTNVAGVVELPLQPGEAAAATEGAERLEGGSSMRSALLDELLAEVGAPPPPSSTAPAAATDGGKLVRYLGRRGHTLMVLSYAPVGDSDASSTATTPSYRRQRRLLWVLSYPGSQDQWAPLVQPPGSAGAATAAAPAGGNDADAWLRDEYAPTTDATATAATAATATAATGSAHVSPTEAVLADVRARVGAHFDEPAATGVLLPLVAATRAQVHAMAAAADTDPRLFGPRQIYSLEPAAISGTLAAYWAGGSSGGSSGSAGADSPPPRLPVFLLGDAAHATTTHRGGGANAAIADGLGLADALLAWARDAAAPSTTAPPTVPSMAPPVVPRLAAWEAGVLARGAALARESLSSTGMIHAGVTGWGHTLRWAILRGVGAVAALVTAIKPPPRRQ